MNKNLGHKVAAAIFGLMAAVHLLRLFTGWDVVIGTWNVPLWVSGVAIVVLGALTVWLFRLSADRQG